MEEEMEMSLMGVKPITHYRGLILKENERAGSKPFNSISIPFLNKNKINLLFWFRQFMKTKLNEMAELK